MRARGMMGMIAVLLAACQMNPVPFPDQSTSLWSMPLISDSSIAVGFGPYAWNQAVWVQVDSQSVGLRRSSDGGLLWTYTLPPGWLHDTWILEDVAIRPEGLWMFHDSSILRIDPYSGLGQALAYPFQPNQWTTRMGYVEGERVYIPIYDAQSVSLWRGGMDAPWNAIHSHILAPQEYALIDGIWAHGNRGAATLRRWHAGMQSGALDLLQWLGDSSWTIPLAEDLGLGVPILGDTARIFIATAERVLGFDLTQQTLSWSSLLPFAWPIPGWCLLPEGLLCLNHEGEGVLLDPGTGALRQSYLLPGTAWIDRIRPGPLGAYVAWDRGIYQLGGFGARKSHARSTLLSPVVAVLGDGVVCRDEQFLYRLGP